MENVIFFFDSDCLMCNSFINFMLVRKINDNVKFCSLRNLESTMHDITELNEIELKNKTAIFFEKDTFYFQSSAIIKVLSYTNFNPLLLSVMKLFPYRLLDFFYSIIAKNRHRIYGNSSCTCKYSPDLAERIIRSPHITSDDDGSQAKKA